MASTLLRNRSYFFDRDSLQTPAAMKTIARVSMTAMMTAVSIN